MTLWYLCLELLVSADRTYSLFLSNKQFAHYMEKPNVLLVISRDQQFLNAFKKCYLVHTTHDRSFPSNFNMFAIQCFQEFPHMFSKILIFQLK